MAAPLCFIMYFGFEFIYSFEVLGSIGFYLKSLGIDYHYDSISRGVIDTRDILYFASVVLIFLLATRVVLVSRKW
jgi:ABC-2 type transport system permease protein